MSKFYNSELTIKQYNNIITNFSHGLLICDKNMDILFFNKSFEMFFDMSLKQIKKNSKLDHYCDFLDENKEKLKLDDYPVNKILFSKESISNQIIGFIKKDNKNINWFLYDGFLEKDIKGNITHIIITFTDITDFKNSKDALNENREKYYIAFTTSPDAVNINTMEGRYVEVNEGFKNLTGYTEKDVIGVLSTDIDIWTIKEDREKLTEELRKHGKISNLESIFRCKDGNLKTALMSAQIIEINNIPHILSITRDITEKRILEEQLKQSQKLEAIGQLAGGISHDFNNLLSGILGCAELIKLSSSLSEKNENYLSIIIDTVNRASELTKKLLAFSQKRIDQLKKVSIHNIIENTATLLKNTIDRRIETKLYLDSEKNTIMGDISSLQSIFLNLGINASHAMKNGGVISISSKLVDLTLNECRSNEFKLYPGKYIEIIIKDTGEGIEKNNISKIFEPFFTTKEQGKGTGLGLSVIYGIIKQYKGSINVESKKNIGTSFKILFPLVDSSPIVDNSFKTMKYGKGTILLVDDEDIVRISCSDFLSNLGYDVILSSNGEEALNLYKNNIGKIDLVILDMIMPKMNGKDCFFKLKNIDKNVKVIVLSGFFKDNDIHDMKKEGIFALVKKPYESIELSHIISDAIKG